MKKFIKWLAGLCLLPLCWAVSQVVFLLLQMAPTESSGWTEWAVPAGFVVSVAGFFVLPRALRTYVLAHELTHAVWGMLMGAKVGKMKVGKNGGEVMLSKNNFIIALAPYFFPFYTGLVIAAWFAVGYFYDLSAYESWWLVAVGLTWGFHVTYTIYMLSQHQPDVQENGRVFSYIIIYLVSLLCIALWVIMIGDPTFHTAWDLLCPATYSAYKWIGGVILAGWNGLLALRPPDGFELK